MNQSLTITLDTTEILKEIEGFSEMVKDYHCIPILLEGINSHMHEPFKSQVLNQWEKQINMKGE